MKWGDRYPANYVNLLAEKVAHNLSHRHRFVCFTDNGEGLAPAVEVRPMPRPPLARSAWNRGIWPKLCLFCGTHFPAGTRILYLDLDVMILGALDPLVERINEGGLWIIREWNPTLVRLLPLALRPDRGGNSSVVGWLAGTQEHIYRTFCTDPEAALKGWRNDQQFITAHAQGLRYWPYRWCASFKRHCVHYGPINRLLGGPRKPGWCTILVFHGKPDPADLIGEDPGYRWGSRRRYGYGPVCWVKQYWQGHTLTGRKPRPPIAGQPPAP